LTIKYCNKVDQLQRACKLL